MPDQPSKAAEFIANMKAEREGGTTEPDSKSPAPSTAPSQPKTMTSAAALLKDAIASSGAYTVAPPPKSSDLPKEPLKDGYLGVVPTQDGRVLHSYIVDGQRVLLPKRQEEMTDEDYYSVSNLALADPSSARIPQNLTVKFRDPQWAGHWFNRKADSGRALRRSHSLGFIPVHKEDLEWYSASLNDEDGSIVDGDLVLMKISKVKLYAGFLKSYFDEARLKGGVAHYKQTAEAMTGADTKVSHYLTPQAEKEFQGLGPVVNLQTVS